MRQYWEGASPVECSCIFVGQITTTQICARRKPILLNRMKDSYWGFEGVVETDQLAGGAERPVVHSGRLCLSILNDPFRAEVDTLMIVEQPKLKLWLPP